jgi:hypothetical protein
MVAALKMGLAISRLGRGSFYNRADLIPKALGAMQSLFVAAAGVSGADFWIPLK